jgi:DNA-binding protein HU-beta
MDAMADRLDGRIRVSLSLLSTLQATTAARENALHANGSLEVGRTSALTHTQPPQRDENMPNYLTKSQLVEKISEAHSELSKRDIKGVIETLATVGYKELKKAGIFVVPGFAKFVVVKKPATKAREGTNPFTGEKMMFKAKPARKIVRARPVKAVKDSV